MLNHILKQIILLLGSVIVASKSDTLIVLSVAITLVSILIIMLNTFATCSECLDNTQVR